MKIVVKSFHMDYSETTHCKFIYFKEQGRIRFLPKDGNAGVGVW